MGVLMKRSLAVFAIPLLFGLGACSSAEEPTSAGSDGAVGQAAEPPADTGASPQAPQDSAAPPATTTSGSITLTIGEETWAFDSALCAYANAPAGEPGSEWNVSSTKGDNQVYVSDDSYGPRVSIADVANPGSMEWVAEGDAVTLTVAGSEISAEGSFTDLSGLQQDGTLRATCASWVEG
jgi:hypothetical protein